MIKLSQTLFGYFVSFLKMLASMAYSGMVSLQPPPPPPTDPVANAILAYNNNLSNFKGTSVFTDAPKNVIIHKLDPDTAKYVAAQISSSAKQYGLPLTYVLGCVAIESTFDPMCQNGNTGPGETNQANNPLGYDMGAPQLKLLELIGQPGITDAVTAKAFAFDITKSIPYAFGITASNIKAAAAIIAKNTSSAPDVRLQNEYTLAAALYNFGSTGGRKDYEDGVWPSHCQEVVDLERYFAKVLGLPSIFVNLPSP